MGMLWIIIMILLFIAETQILNFIAIWFAFSSFLAYLSTFYIEPFFSQFLIFLIGGILMTLFMRNKLFSKLNKNINK